jgi:hypothetical protein
MKAIYINLDPYLAAIAAWIKGGKTGGAPHFDPLPLAVTVPLGQDVAIAALGAPDDTYIPSFVVGDVTLYAYECGLYNWEEDADWVEKGVALPFSAYPPTEGYPQTYNVARISGDTATVKINISTDEDITDISFPILVRRETASGPVDLVDFTPPAAAIAAGTDLNGCTFDGNAIEAAADTGVLSAPAAGG